MRERSLGTMRFVQGDEPEFVTAGILAVEVEPGYVVVRGRCGKAYRCPAKEAATLAERITAAAKEATEAREVIFPRLGEADGLSEVEL